MALTQISTDGVKNDAVTAGKIPADAVGQSEIADEAVNEARLQVSNAGSNGQFLQKQSGNTGGLTWATVTVPDSDKIEEGNTSIETVDTGSDGHVKITTEGTERVRVSNDGKVGIGVTSPNATFHVNSPDVALGSDGNILIRATTAGADVGGQITFGNDNARRAAIAGNQDGSDAIAGYMQLGTRGTSGDVVERFRVGSAGQLGVGGATYGSSGQVLTSGGPSAAPSWATPASGGLSEVDAWTLTGSWPFVHSGGSWSNARLGNHANDQYTGTLTRHSENNMPLGTGMTNTDGLFTFPSAGTWRIDCMLHLERYSSSNMNGLRVGLCGDVDGNARQFTTTEQDVNMSITHTTINLAGIMKFTNTGTSNFYVKLNGSGNVYIKALSATQNLIFTKLA